MPADDERKFRSLALHNWRQFGDAEIDFDQRLTVLTGANATGKSTILALLAKHFAWQRSFSKSPKRTKSGYRWTIHDLTPTQPSHRVGSLTYSDGHTSALQAPQDDQSTSYSQYQVSYEARHEVAGIFLTSHRVVASNYTQVESIPTLFGGSEQILNQFTQVVRNHWLGAGGGGKSAQLRLKESLIAAAVFGEGSESVDRNEEAWAIWTGFQRVLGDVFPASLGYQGIRIREGEVIVEAEGGAFIIDEVSGGLSALIEMVWQIFLQSRQRAGFTVLIDEPENHLHPSLQREVLPTLLRAFPTVQFIVATHSPFVVTASPSSAVYVLDYRDDRKVASRRLDYANKAGSADETLREVLGLDSTMPTWAEDRFESILSNHLRGAISPDQVAALRADLQENGLASSFPDALLAASDQIEDAEGKA